jgi:hypothetical protein
MGVDVQVHVTSQIEGSCVRLDIESNDGKLSFRVFLDKLELEALAVELSRAGDRLVRELREDARMKRARRKR